MSTAGTKHTLEDVSNTAAASATGDSTSALSAADNPKKIKQTLEDVSNMAAVPSAALPVAEKPKKIYTAKQIEQKMETATAEQIKPLLVDIYTQHPYDTKTLQTFLTRTDLRSRCFRCMSKKNRLQDLAGDLVVCHKCEVSQEEFNRTEVTEVFGLSKGDANQITRSTGTSGYGGIKYIYRLSDIVVAIRNEEKFQKKVTKSQMTGWFPPSTCNRFNSATSKEDKQKIIRGALNKVSSEKELKDFFLQSVKKVRELKEVGGFLEAL